jgi:hypothetical protein
MRVRRGSDRDPVACLRRGRRQHYPTAGGVPGIRVMARAVPGGRLRAAGWRWGSEMAPGHGRAARCTANCIRAVAVTRSR